jgi:RimJ/RimL family protein N-acetyltransferase
MSPPILRWLLRGPARRLRGGDRIAIRAIRPDDRARLLQAFHALDARSVYRRFFFPKRALSDEELRQITECDGARVVVLVATVGGGDKEIIVGLGQYARRGTTAEIAFAVEEDFQGRGIASALLRHLTDIARDGGVTQFEADVLADNAAMLKVFRRSELPRRESESAGIVHVTLFLTAGPVEPCAA